MAALFFIVGLLLFAGGLIGLVGGQALIASGFSAVCGAIFISSGVLVERITQVRDALAKALEAETAAPRS